MDEKELKHFESPRSRESGEWSKDSSSVKSNEYVVAFEEGDHRDPKNWNSTKKWRISTIVYIINVVTAMISSGYSLGIPGVTGEWGTPRETAVLGTTLFLVGRGIGPPIVAPLSEVFGRLPVFHFTIISFGFLQIGCALATNIGMLLTFRLLSGIAGSVGSNIGGTFSDLWIIEDSGPSICGFSVVVLAGAQLGPIVYGWIYEALGWRWIFWIQLILTGCVELLVLVGLPETRDVTILSKIAKQKRKDTGNPNWKAKNDPSEINFVNLMKNNLSRPLKMMCKEPVVTAFSIYASFLFGILFLNLGAFELIFKTNYGFNQGQVGLSFLGVFVGYISVLCFHPIQERVYQNRRRKRNGEGCPEDRLFIAFFGAILLPIGLFWFAWTTYKEVHWIVPILSGIPFGLGSSMLFTSIFCYLTDNYKEYSSSALAALNFSRNALAAGFSLFARQMFQNLGFQWAGSTLAFISVALAPIPFFIFYFGKRFRSKSHQQLSK